MEIPSQTRSEADLRRLPRWLARNVGEPGKAAVVTRTLADLRINTVCHFARCPNRAECSSNGTATFLIGGTLCSRSCRFCAVETSRPAPLDADEPSRIAEAAARMGLSYVVLTMVSRDDIADGGAAHVASVISEVRIRLSGVGIEALTSDFAGDARAIKTVVEAGPSVFAHNMETVERLYPEIRPQAGYRRSLEVLKLASRVSGGKIPTKSGIMLGLGETDQEVMSTLYDLREHGVSILTMGQYLQPGSDGWPVRRYVHPEVFANLKKEALAMGFSKVASAPFVRSSYRAEEMAFVSGT